MSNAHAFLPGAKVKALDPDHRILGNRTYTVESCRSAGLQGDQHFEIRLEEASAREFPAVEFIYAETPDRDRIPLRLTKDTSKAYATKQASRSLTPDVNSVLKDAGKGNEVDAIDFRKAVTAALSLAATRDGQSMGRRNWTKECRHLLYIADAVIDSALVGLPPIDYGTRRSGNKDDLKVAREAIGYLEDTNAKLHKDVTTLTARVADLHSKRAGDADLFVNLAADRADFERQVGDLTEVLDYAKSLLENLDQVALGQVYGFEDAIAAGNR